MAETFFSLPRLLQALRHQIFWAMLFFVSVLGLVAIATELTPRTYHSQSKLFIRLGRENTTLDPTATLGQSPAVAFPSSRENEINSVIEILKNRVLLEQVVDRITPEVILGRKAWQTPASNGTAEIPPPTPPSQVVDARYLAIAHLNKQINVQAVKKSNVIEISYEGTSPEVAQAVVNSLVESFLTEHVRINRTPGAHKFQVEQTEQQKAKLTKLETELSKLKETTGLIDPNSQRQRIVDRMHQLDTDLLMVLGLTAATEAEVKALQQRSDGLDPTSKTISRGLPNQAADAMRAQLYALQIKELEMRSKFPENHPEISLIRRQTTAAEAVLAKEEREREQVTSGPNRAYEEIKLSLLRQESALAALKARSSTLQQQLVREQERAASFIHDQVRVTELQREVDLQDMQYRRVVESLDRARIDHALEVEKISNVNVIQPANFDVKPVRPNRMMNAAMGFVAATVGAIGLAMLLEYRQKNTRSEENSSVSSWERVQHQNSRNLYQDIQQ